MPRQQKPIMVIGHKNPDTDSVCAAITYARFKSEQQAEEAVPLRAGNINPQTSFVLSRFETESPALATDMYPRIDDIMVPREQLFAFTPNVAIGMACQVLTEKRYSFVPVVDESDMCVGRITTLKLVEVLRGLGDRNLGPDGLREILDSPIGPIVEKEHKCFHPHDFVHDVLRQIGHYNEGGFIVTDDDGVLRGVITRVNFLTEARFRVVMVDHNEISQSVDGMEEAEVIEILDHHRLANKTTSMPITFINKVVGSTCTIIAELYRLRGATPPVRDAGLMLSAILSDTLVLRSPTTTPLDRDMAAWLAGLAAVDLNAYGEEMFAAGAALEGTDPLKLISQDRKEYTEGKRRFSVSQLESVGFGPILSMKAGLIAELDRLIETGGCMFACLMITDITRDTSLLLCRGDARLIDSIGYPRKEDWVFEMKSVVSRKKQVLPYLVDLLSKL